MATVTQCDICKNICNIKDAYVIRVEHRHTMDTLRIVELCPTCGKKVIERLKQEAAK